MNNQPYPYRLKQKEPHILILIVMSSFAAMGAVIFTPSLPEIAQYFHISQGRSQLAVTLFLLGYALGQLIYGPLANRLGRKSAFYVGICIATLGSIISILSTPFNSFIFLIFGRMLEALGSSAGLVIAFTIINDYYYPEQARRIVAYLMLAFAVVPGVATFIGGMLVVYFNWVSCFYFLLIYGLLLIIPVSRLAETAATLNKQALHFHYLKQNYSIAFKNKLLRNTAFFFGLTSMCIFIYAANAPFIAIHYLKISPAKYGVMGLIPFMGTALGSIFSACLSSILSAKKLMKLGLSIEIIASILLAILFYLGFVNLLVLILCCFVFMFGGCLIVANGASIATSTLEDKAHASAVMNFINVGMPVCGTFIMAVIPGSPIVKLPIGFLLATFIMANIWIGLINKA